jgi:hypothetical protein
MQERRKSSVWHLQLQVKMLRKALTHQSQPPQQNEAVKILSISILTQEQLAGCQISGEVSETLIGYSMGSHVRIMHFGMQVFHICNYRANLRASADYLSKQVRGRCQPILSKGCRQFWGKGGNYSHHYSLDGRIIR